MYLRAKPITPGSGHEAGRKLLEEMYLHYAGSPMPAIMTTERGKPYFAEGPWHFSISHSKGHVFCALSKKNIGVDAEEIDRQIRPELARRILSPMEWEQYEAAEDPRLALLTFWVLKEALAKYTGEGIKLYPNHTDFSLSDPRVREYHGCLVAVIEEEDHVI